MTTVGVCGFGRCGSTMVMEMLASGGVPTAPGADPLSHEHPWRQNGIGWLAAQDLDGRAVKLLDMILYPDETPLPQPESWRLVWIDRNPRQQARSHVKFLRSTGLRVPAVSVKTFEGSYAADRPRALAALSDLGPVHVDSYERALAEPAAFAVALSAFLHPALHLDAATAARVVHARSPRCVDGMEFERTGRVPVAAT
jgi:hypothetical protein